MSLSDWWWCRWIWSWPTIRGGVYVWRHRRPHDERRMFRYQKCFLTSLSIHERAHQDWNFLTNSKVFPVAKHKQVTMATHAWRRSCRDTDVHAPHNCLPLFLLWLLWRFVESSRRCHERKKYMFLCTSFIHLNQNQNQTNLLDTCVRHMKNLTWRLACPH